MKSLFESFIVAFSMYSKIPMPHIEWSEKSMKYSMCFFPWIGLVIGLLEYLWFLLCGRTGVSDLLRSSIAVAIPLLVTGGIHFDGFLDTTDALSSWRTREERLRILKDS
ncbi:MAG: adenosylcobinamide-GDP ribazoletransferase, partial [Bilifractor sp.]|nr:adenosylcobinamide-GDP ribazoletransferase [Bilifractor sp.]